MSLTRFGRTIARYYLGLRMSAALAVPDLASREIPWPTPIVRRLPGRVHNGWDEREMIRSGDEVWIVVQEERQVAKSPFIWN